tara:strand:- start:82145 stop:82351 length:207 start_codon:yes stop_codon:yes gene_type:complete
MIRLRVFKAIVVIFFTFMYSYAAEVLPNIEDNGHIGWWYPPLLLISIIVSLFLLFLIIVFKEGVIKWQ